jgi:hypothetical protein
MVAVPLFSLYRKVIFIYVFICEWFNDTASNMGYIESNVMIRE